MPIEVRDTRRKQMFQVDDEYLNSYARLCGVYATCVYISLCRHANAQQESWPSIELIQAELAMGSNRTVLKAIKKLEEWGIIHVVKSKNEKTKRQNVNTYVLVDKCYWKPKPSAPDALGAECISRRDPSASHDQKPSARGALEGNTREKETHRRSKLHFSHRGNARDPVTGADLGFVLS